MNRGKARCLESGHAGFGGRLPGKGPIYRDLAGQPTLPTWYGSALLVADRWYPSSKTCSACGWRKPNLPLAERTWTCDGCGAEHDRDLNAATKLARLSEHTLSVEGRPAGSGPVAGRGADRRTRAAAAATAGGCETSTPHSRRTAAGKTGTAPPQGEAA